MEILKLSLSDDEKEFWEHLSMSLRELELRQRYREWIHTIEEKVEEEKQEELKNMASLCKKLEEVEQECPKTFKSSLKNYHRKIKKRYRRSS